MKMNARSRSYPFPNRLGFVSAEVVQNDVQLPLRMRAPIEQLEERQKLLAVGAFRDFANHFPGQRVERGVKTGGTVCCNAL